MTVKDVEKDPAGLRMVITAELDAPAERVWQLWADPRQLERWWGPPEFPATVVDHELVAGGSVTYFMTGPDGGKHRGWWRILAVDPPRSLELEDGFADDDGVPVPDLPTTTMRVDISPHDGVTRMVMTSTFASPEAMEQTLAMGAEDGIRAALAQIDALLAP